jgi:hypothetical protein
MPQRVLARIQDAILNGEYDFTHHAVDEMAEDGLGIFDVEQAVLSGEIKKTETDDPRGPRYTIIGLAENQKAEVGVGVVRCTDISASIVMVSCRNG